MIADVVETGSTLMQAGLELVGEPILHSEAVLVQRDGAESTPAIEQLERRLNGVIVASAYVIVDYDVRTDLLDAACALTPELSHPPCRRCATPSGWQCAHSSVAPRQTQ